MENKSIACSISNCEHNCNSQYCTLSQITVGTHETNPTMAQCTDCQSFKLKNDNCCGGCK